MQQVRVQHTLPPLTHPARGHLIAAGDTVPTDGDDGYCPGCLFFHMDGSGNGAVLYVNVGTKTSANFDPMYGFAQGAALTAADGSTVDTTYGQEEADVISNLVTRVGEIEARLEAAGIIASN